MRLAIVGAVIGIAAAFGINRFIASFLFGVKTWGPRCICNYLGCIKDLCVRRDWYF